jgi:hypothetical protein
MNGWNKNELYSVLAALDEAQEFNYEINNCIRGCYTGAKTYTELKERIQRLASKLAEAADEIDGAWLDSHDEEEEA